MRHEAYMKQMMEEAEKAGKEADSTTRQALSVFMLSLQPLTMASNTTYRETSSSTCGVLTTRTNLLRI